MLLWLVLAMQIACVPLSNLIPESELAAAVDSRFVLITISFIGGEKKANVRVKALAAFKKPKTLIVLLAIVVLCAGCVWSVLNPRIALRIPPIIPHEFNQQFFCKVVLGERIAELLLQAM